MSDVDGDKGGDVLGVTGMCCDYLPVCVSHVVREQGELCVISHNSYPK